MRTVSVCLARLLAETTVVHVAHHVAAAESFTIAIGGACSLAGGTPAPHWLAAIIIIDALFTVCVQALLISVRAGCEEEGSGRNPG